jgi:hypothetical protein
MLRGPVAHLGLAQQLSEADEKFDTDPAAAAGLYGLVADKLQGSPYAPHAPRIRARQADAFHTAGDNAKAVTSELAVMAAAQSSGDPGLTLTTADKLARQRPDIPEPLVRSVNALAALAAHGTTRKPRWTRQLAPSTPPNQETRTRFSRRHSWRNTL